MKIIFFGDSITDAGRDRSNPADLGPGYVKIAADELRLLYPEIRLEILNRGVGGDRTEQLLMRMREDVIEEHPDVVVMEVGINDVWHRFLTGVVVTEEEFRARYTELVETLKGTGASLILLQPYALNVPDMRQVRPYLDQFNAVIDEIVKAEEVPLIRMDEIFTELSREAAPTDFAADGVHPTPLGCRHLADHVIEEIRKVISV